MPITTPTAPPQGVAALQSSLQYLLGRGTASDPNTPQGGALDQVNYSQPHQSYVIGLDAMLNGQFLDAAQAVTWRYLLFSGQDVLADAQLATASDGTLGFVALTYGTPVTETVNALLDLEQNNASVQGGNYELRFLTIPAIGFYGLWLHGDSDDIIRPIAPTPTVMIDAVAYSAGTILQYLQTAAQSVSAQIAQFTGPSGG